MEEPKYHLEGVVKTRSENLEDFEGPLDVILLLLSKNKIEIQDVSITAILDQYLAYLEEMKRLDMEIASEFITMASHLMLIKTKMLLSASEQEEAMSEMELLRRSLEERQRKEAMEKIRGSIQFLEGRNEIGRCLFTKQPEPLRKDKTYRYQHDWTDLLRALAAMAERRERQLPPPADNFAGIVGAEPYPVSKKSKELLQKLLLNGDTSVKQLFAKCRSRSEIVATFLAILELCRMKCIFLTDVGNDMLARFLQMPENPKEDSHGT